MVGTEPPALTIPRTPEQPPRRRSPWLGVVILALVLTIAGLAVVLSNYQPVSMGNQALGATVPGGREDPDGTVSEFLYAPDGRIVATTWLFNSGPWGVTVTGVDMGPEDQLDGLLQLAGTRIARDSNPVDLSASRPFHPLALRPGDHVGIQFRFRIRPCVEGEANSASGRGSVYVHFRVAGISRTETFELQPGVQVRVPDGTSCTGHLS